MVSWQTSPILGTWTIDSNTVIKTSAASWSSYIVAELSAPSQEREIQINNITDTNYVCGFSTQAFIDAATNKDQECIEYGFYFFKNTGTNPTWDAKAIVTIDGGYSGHNVTSTLTTASKIKLSLTATSFTLSEDVSGSGSYSDVETVTFSSDTTERRLVTNNYEGNSDNSLTATGGAAPPTPSSGTRLPPPPIVLGGL